MQPKRIAMLFPYAPAYRAAIYQMMDRELNIDWFFAGNADRNLELLDYSCLKRSNLQMKEKPICGPIWKLGGITQLKLDEYDIIIFAGVIRCISEWWLIFKYGHRKHGPKLYLWTHGWYGKETFVEKLIKKFFFSWVNGIFLYGNYAKNLMVHEGFDEKKLFVIGNSLDYDTQIKIREQLTNTGVFNKHFDNSYHVLIMIGRLTFRKHLDILIKAVAKLKGQGENYNIVFIGDGEDRDKLERLVSECNLQRNVWFYGACYDEIKNAELIYNADVCVVPGDIGLTAIHAMTFGVPVISHNCYKFQGPEFESIKSGLTGRFFEFENADSLASTISQWFFENVMRRDEVRHACYREIDSQWNPYYQIGVLKSIVDPD